MQHPEHLIGNTRAGMTPQRMVGLAFVGLIHIAVIYALIMGLVPHFLSTKSGPLIVDVLRTKEPPRQPAPHLPTFQGPTIDTVVPQIPTNSSSTNTVSTNPGSSGTTETLVPDTMARGVAGTHTIPDYPELARRLNKQGTVQLRLSIAPDGTVIDAVVENSSGSDVLDQAAIDWVKMHWRYQPATHAGRPVVGSAEAAIRFDLRTASR